MFIAFALAELGSAAPTSGGLYYWTWTYATPRWRNVLSWIVGCRSYRLGIDKLISPNFRRFQLHRAHSRIGRGRLGLRGPGHGRCVHRHRRKLRPYDRADFVSSSWSRRRYFITLL